MPRLTPRSVTPVTRSGVRVSSCLPFPFFFNGLARLSRFHTAFESGTSCDRYLHATQNLREPRAWAVFSRDRLRLGHAVVITLMVLVLSVRMSGFVHDGTTLARGTQTVKTSGEIVSLLLIGVGFALQTYRMERMAITH
jgi:hypothetical protein